VTAGQQPPKVGGAVGLHWADDAVHPLEEALA
jgi:hypothetical protein